MFQTERTPVSGSSQNSPPPYVAGCPTFRVSKRDSRLYAIWSLILFCFPWVVACAGGGNTQPALAHLVKPRLTLQQSPNPFRVLSLRIVYVHSCMANNILFAYCAPKITGDRPDIFPVVILL